MTDDHEGRFRVPLYRLGSYQGDRVLGFRTVELEDDEAAERELLKDEDEFARGLRGMGPEELIQRFAAGSIGFRAKREPPRDDTPGASIPNERLPEGASRAAEIPCHGPEDLGPEDLGPEDLGR